MSIPKNPARVQVKEEDLPEGQLPPQSGTVFNIWYQKWSQGATDNARFKSPYRCHPDLDTGYTKGDTTGSVVFCLFFAKGFCSKGKKCQYLHRVPTEEDIWRLQKHSGVLDCFGREKFADYRDDMGGVGSFRKTNRTLFIGSIVNSIGKSIKPEAVEAKLRKEFGMFGDLDRARYISDKNCAFIKFRYQTHAEFAKEAMANQTLFEGDEKAQVGLLCRWASPDPDPESRKREELEEQQHSIQVVQSLLQKFEKSQKRELSNEPETVEIEPVVKKTKNEGIVGSDSLKLLSKMNVRLSVNVTPAVPDGPLVAGYGSSSSDDEE